MESCLCRSVDRKVKREWTGQLGLLEHQVEEQRRLAREFEQRSIMDSTRLQTMEQLLEKKDMEHASMQRQLRSRPTPELSSYIEGYKIAMAGGDGTKVVPQIETNGTSAATAATMSRFLEDSKRSTVPQSFLADIDTIPTIGAEAAESEISRVTTAASNVAPMSTNSSIGGESQRQSAADLLFAALDADGDGVITKEEMRRGLSRGAKRSGNWHKRSRNDGSVVVNRDAGADLTTSRTSVQEHEPEAASGVGLLLAKSDMVRAPVIVSCSLLDDRLEQLAATTPHSRTIFFAGMRVNMYCATPWTCRLAVGLSARLGRVTTKRNSTARPRAR